jgi:large subunit ribosomal protein L24
MTAAKLKIKKGDQVVVITGRYKGTKGEVLSVNPTDAKVVVQGVNMATKHNKPSQANPQGGITKAERPIHVSNVALADPKTGKASRVGYKVQKDGTKVRVARKSGDTVE